MRDEIRIHTPFPADSGEVANYISHRSVCTDTSPVVIDLYRAFLERYTRGDELLAFLEWIIAQLQLPKPDPGITIKTGPIPKDKISCKHADDCMHRCYRHVGSKLLTRDYCLHAEQCMHYQDYNRDSP